MSEKILVPVLGESITEATVSKWLKNEGDPVEADEPLVELETDKVNLEVPSPVSGVLTKINSKNGSVVEVGADLGSVSESETKSRENQEIKKIQPTVKVDKENLIDEDDKDEEMEVFQDNVEEEKPLVLTKEVEPSKVEAEIKIDETLSPAVRKIVTENKIDISSVKGSGKDGRVLKGDLINLMGVNPPPSERKIKFGQEERIKMTRLRQTIAKRLKQAQDNAALLTTFNEVDMSNVMMMRKENQDDFQNRYGVKLGFMSLSYDHRIVDGKESVSFLKMIKEISEKAKNEKLTIEDLQGGTFTISNGGVYGSMLSTPILNLPQSGVLGMHNIVDRPIVVDGEIKIRPIMYLALSYDHRIVDGKESVSFLKMIKENLEEPRRLFLDI